MFTDIAVTLFWEKVGIVGSCWEWKASRFPSGYGQTSFTVYAERYSHRVSWLIHFGPIPDGLCVLHSCDNPPCVNPSHLFLGTNAENSEDMIRKGRSRRARGEKQGLAKLKEVQVIEIRRRISAGETDSSIAADFPVGHASIWAIRAGKSWKYLSTAPQPCSIITESL